MAVITDTNSAGHSHHFLTLPVSQSCLSSLTRYLIQSSITTLMTKMRSSRFRKFKSPAQSYPASKHPSLGLKECKACSLLSSGWATTCKRLIIKPQLHHTNLFLSQLSPPQKSQTVHRIPRSQTQSSQSPMVWGQERSWLTAMAIQWASSYSETEMISKWCHLIVLSLES